MMQTTCSSERLVATYNTTQRTILFSIVILKPQTPVFHLYPTYTLLLLYQLQCTYLYSHSKHKFLRLVMQFERLGMQ
jgi:hypothetical protein